MKYDPILGDMFLQTFNSLELPIQCREEWLGFLEFADGYFAHRGILHPVIVEIGTRLNLQKAFYSKLLGGLHIGVDISDAEAVPDILGDSTAPETVEKVKAALAGRPIDLLFIDGSHEYAGVKRDYEIYAPMTRHIVALHDVNLAWAEVARFWGELKAAEAKAYTFITFDAWTEPILRLGCATNIGIGAAVRRGA